MYYIVIFVYVYTDWNKDIFGIVYPLLSGLDVHMCTRDFSE